ncbi:hypothetical protein [Hymenobacter perfusus]|uniref:Magnesium citrate secondary transporter n=1 Tax=Hymenobacter perfusus TaxID=1236770 RepID=A0A3R9ND98_9BACT|nr:hypothetical protein [Hymenobacter perfusus]RSK44566.1 hypothetical protein EI293_08610 [Hymenobacter perfusus]
MVGNDTGRLKLPAELRQPLFWAGVGLYLLALTQKRGGPLLHLAWWPTFLNGQLTDVLTLPLELTLMLWWMRRYYFRQPQFVLPTSWIFSCWLFTAIWFEGIWPRFSASVTADWLDVVAYALGGLIFWRWMNRPARV